MKKIRRFRHFNSWKNISLSVKATCEDVLHQEFQCLAGVLIHICGHHPKGTASKIYFVHPEALHEIGIDHKRVEVNFRKSHVIRRKEVFDLLFPNGARNIYAWSDTKHFDAVFVVLLAFLEMQIVNYVECG